ncbi:SGNH/GDSL hydrolase family protein [Gordonia hydrophobica]|uniref:SGNH/GDSL hydrolase family protein n=1 Tax=Gordonia hydrophobica TaxID=40516 RepID=A0ABZ2TW07_9ACTN|nr:SGNH/GDSL hydrolase family protein [Gordonia hydrophobica]MBM7365974.1 lysophospholipase L1-like esterase [Gordonia hydrophobica]
MLTPTLSVIAILLVAVGGAIWVIDATPRDPRPAEQGVQADADGRPQLVHLGDSYASGAGTTPLVEDSPFACQRSQRNFGELVGLRRGMDVVDVACAGATTANLFQGQYDGVAPQLDAVTSKTALVTLMIGGNDSAIYMTMVGECTRRAADDPTGSPCRKAFGTQPFREIDDSVGADVERGLRSIRDKAPNARVVVAGYPWLMPARTSCRPAVGIADGDVDYVHRVQQALNDAISAAANRVGVTFVDMAARSIGHEACSPKGMRWIEPQIGADSAIVMHPNALGQRAIADAVGEVLG